MIMAPTEREPVTEQTRKSAVSSDLAPLYAVAGLTEVVTERLRTVATESRQRVSERIAALRTYSDERVSAASGDLGGRSLPELVRTMPEFTKQQLVKVGEYADAGRAKAGAAYAELAGRGKVGVEGALGGAVESLDPVLERLQDGVARLRESVAGRSAAATPTATPPVPKPAAEPVVKPVAEPPAEKPVAEKPVAKKTTAKKPAAKKTAS
jgi:hypothetical protein